ncbi:MerR family transcriptional regulator [Microbacterium sp. NPDC056234]|uniref:MerR family transcriptional regulator n=1 Tax=Microbacterium sp. NPDC056234 TaxID=3345757 RepID=UPI0035E241D6
MPAEETALTIAQMSAATGVSAHTLRYYERAGLIHAIARTTGNRRRYSDADIEWVRFLLRLRETGMPIAQMREYAELRRRGPASIERRLNLLEEHRKNLREQIACLHEHDQALARKIATYEQEMTTARPRGAER